VIHRKDAAREFMKNMDVVKSVKDKCDRCDAATAHQEKLEEKLSMTIEAIVKLTNERAAAYGHQYNAIECPGAIVLAKLKSGSDSKKRTVIMYRGDE
jgi:hypothetical protein